MIPFIRSPLVESSNGENRAVVRNALTGRPTHPYVIHEILIFHQRLDPLYRLEV